MDENTKLPPIDLSGLTGANKGASLPPIDLSGLKKKEEPVNPSDAFSMDAGKNLGGGSPISPIQPSSSEDGTSKAAPGPVVPKEVKPVPQPTPGFNTTKLSPKDEEGFQKFWNENPRVQAWKQDQRLTKGGEDSPDNPDYDYRGAWKSGITPVATKNPSTKKWELNWGNFGSDGQDLKSPNNPTKWKSDYQQAVGVDPDKIGITEARAKAEIAPITSEQEYQDGLDKPKDPVQIERENMWLNQSYLMPRIAMKDAADKGDLTTVVQMLSNLEKTRPADPYANQLPYWAAKKAAENDARNVIVQSGIVDGSPTPDDVKGILARDPSIYDKYGVSGFLDKALALNPDDPTLNGQKVVMAANSGNWKDALLYDDKLMSLPPDPNKLAQMEREHMALGAKTKAMQNLSREEQGSNTPEHTKIMNDEVDKLTDQRTVLGDAIKEEQNQWYNRRSSMDYIVAQGVGNSLIGKGVQAFLPPGSTDPAFDPWAGYTPSTTESVAAGFVSLLIDSGPMLPVAGWGTVGKGAAEFGMEGLGAFSVGAKPAEMAVDWAIKKNALKAAEKTIAQFVANGMRESTARKAVAYLSDEMINGATASVIKNAAVSAGSLSAYGMMSETATQLADPKNTLKSINWSQVLKRGGEDFLLGGAVGAIGAGTEIGKGSVGEWGADTGLSKQSISTLKANVSAAGFATEVGVFTVGGTMFDPKKQLSDLTFKDFVLSAIPLVGLKIPHILISGTEWVKAQNFDKGKVNEGVFRVELTPDEISLMYDYKGRPKGRTDKNGNYKLNAFPSSDEVINSLNNDPNQLQWFLRSGSIPIETKAKLMYAIEGLMPDTGTPVVSRIDTKSDGGKSVLIAYNAADEPVFARKYGDADAAEKDAMRFTTLIMERQKRTDANSMTVQQKVNISQRLKAGEADVATLKMGLDKYETPWDRTPLEQKEVDRFDAEVAKEKEIEAKRQDALYKSAKKKMEDGEALSREESNIVKLRDENPLSLDDAVQRVRNLVEPPPIETGLLPKKGESEPVIKPEIPIIPATGSRIEWDKPDDGSDPILGSYKLDDDNHVQIEQVTTQYQKPSRIGRLLGKDGQFVPVSPYWEVNVTGDKFGESTGIHRAETRVGAEKIANEIINKNTDENVNSENAIRVLSPDGRRQTVNPGTILGGGETTQEGNRLVSGETGEVKPSSVVFLDGKAFVVKGISGDKFDLGDGNIVDKSKVLVVGDEGSGKPVKSLLDRPVSEVNPVDINDKSLNDEVKYRTNRLNVEVLDHETAAVSAQVLNMMSDPANAGKSLNEVIDQAVGEYEAFRKVDKEPINGADPVISKDAKGSETTTPSFSLNDAVRNSPKNKGNNLWVRMDPGKDNSDRVLLVQFSNSDLLNRGRLTGDPTELYYDKLYRTRPGFDRTFDFWEIPLWMSRLSHIVDKSDVYVVRDMDEAIKFIKEAGYDRVAFSTLMINEPHISRIAEEIPGQKISVGGYTEFKSLSEKPNVTVYKTVSEFAVQNGYPDVHGYSYRHFRGTRVIPRLSMSEGCLFHCAFCSEIPRVITETPKDIIDSQVESIKDLDARLIYLDDKTFGQSKNHTYLTEIYKRIKEVNPDFEGFIIQTTAGQMLKFDNQFLEDAHIKYVELGIESFNDPILRRLHKPALEKQMELAAEKLRENKINFIPNLVVGFEGKDKVGDTETDWSETPESYARTADYLNKNLDIISHINVNSLALYDGTELSDNIGANIEGNNNQNVVEKPYQKNPSVHRQAILDFTKIASKALDRVPYGPEPLAKPDMINSLNPDGTISAIFVAPYRDLKITSVEDATSVRERPEYKAYIKGMHELGRIMKVEIKNIDHTIGIFEGIPEVSNRVEVNAKTLDEAEQFAALLGVMSHETQKATIASRYVEPDAPSDGVSDRIIELEFKVDNVEGVLKALKDAGLDATLLDEKGRVQILDFYDNKNEEFNSQVDKFATNLKENGITIEDQTARPVDSRYVTEDRRSQLLKEFGVQVEDGQGGEDQRALWQRATERDAEYRSVNGLTPVNYKDVPIEEKVIPAEVPLMKEIQALQEATKKNPAPESQKNVQSIINGLAKKAVNGLDAVVVQSQEDLPADIRAGIEGNASPGAKVNIRGVYDPWNGKIYFIADNLKNENDAVATWVHEQGIHRGLRSLIEKPEELDKLLGKIYDSVGMDKISQTIDRSYINSFNSGKIGKEGLAEEYLAKIAEKIITKEDLNKMEKGIWQQVVDFVRNAIKSFIGKDVALTDNEIADIIKASTASVYERESPFFPSQGGNVMPHMDEFMTGEESFRSIGINPNKTNNLRKIYEKINEYYERKKWRVTDRLKSEKDKKGDELARIIAHNKSVRHQIIPRLSKFIALEVEHMIDTYGMSDRSGVGWYTKQYEKAIDTLSTVYPELKTNEHGERDLFTMLTAITSDQTEVNDNLQAAVEIYEAYKNNGSKKIPYATGGGTKTESYDLNIDRINELLESPEFDGDIKKLSKWLMEKKTGTKFRKEAKELGIKYNSGWEDKMKLPRAVTVFGPKLGVYFSNLMGDEGYPTMDRWESRSFNRYRSSVIPTLKGREGSPESEDVGVRAYKTLIGKPDISDDDAIADATKRTRAYIKRKGPDTVVTKDGITKVKKGGGYWTDIEILVGQKKGTKKEQEIEYEKILANLDVEKAQRDKGVVPNMIKSKEQLIQEGNADTKANGIFQKMNGTVDSPDNAPDRTLQYETFKEAQRKLAEKGYNLSVADVQAALWYFEKDLYIKAGGRENAAGVSYGDVAGPLVKGKLNTGVWKSEMTTKQLKTRDQAEKDTSSGQGRLFSAESEPMSSEDRKKLINGITNVFGKFRDIHPELKGTALVNAFKESVAKTNESIPNDVINEAIFGKKARMKKPADETTAINNATIESELEGREGLQALDALRRHIGAVHSTNVFEAYDIAKAGVNANPEILYGVTNRVLRDHTGNLVDEAVLLIHRAILRNDEIEYLNKLKAEKSPEQRRKLQNDLSEVYRKMSDNDMASWMIGREASNIFRLRQTYVNTELNIGQMEREYMATKSLEELTPEAKAYVAQKFQDLRDAKIRIEELEKAHEADKEKIRIMEVLGTGGRSKNMPKEPENRIKVNVEKLRQIMLAGMKPSSSEEGPVKNIVPKEYSKNMVDDGNGNYIFFRYGHGWEKYKNGMVDPSHWGENSITSDKRSEKVSYYYTQPGDREHNVTGGLHAVRIPKDKVYPFNDDPLNFYDQALALFRKDYGPDVSFSPDKQIDYMNPLIAEAGYDMVVAKWNGKLRAESTKSHPIDMDATRNARGGGAAAEKDDLGSKIKNRIEKEVNTASGFEKYGSLYYAKGGSKADVAELLSNKDIAKLIGKKDVDKYRELEGMYPTDKEAKPSSESSADISRIIKDIAKDHHVMGAKSLDEIVEKTLSDVQQVFPEFTARDIMDHLSGYSKENAPKTRSELATDMANYKREAELRLKLEDTQNGIDTGKVKPKPPADPPEIKELKDQIKDLKNADKPTPAQSAELRKKDRLMQQYEDLKNGITRPKTPAQQKQESQDIIDLRDDIKRLQDKNKPTPEEKKELQIKKRLFENFRDMVENGGGKSGIFVVREGDSEDVIRMKEQGMAEAERLGLPAREYNERRIKYLNNRKNWVQEQIDNEQFTTLKKAAKTYEKTDALLEAEDDYANKVNEWKTERQADLNRNKPPIQRWTENILKWQRFAILGFAGTLAKLAAVVGYGTILKPFMVAWQQVIAQITPKSAKDQMDIWGEAHWSAVSKYYAQFIRNFPITRKGRQNWANMFGGQDPHETQFGKPNIFEEWNIGQGIMEFPGRAHGYIKSFIKNPEFVYATEQISLNYFKKIRDIEQKLRDPNLSSEERKSLEDQHKLYDPSRKDVQFKIGTMSLNHAKWSILMNENDFIQGLQGLFAKGLPGAFLKTELPILRVPLNYIDRALTFKYGLFIALAGKRRLAKEGMPMEAPGLAHLMVSGTKILKPGEADILQRSIVMGSMGAGLFVLGALMRNYLTHNDDGSVLINAGGKKTTISKKITHYPMLESVLAGASAAHEIDKQAAKGNSTGLLQWLEEYVASDAATVKNAPFINMLEYGLMGTVINATPYFKDRSDSVKIDKGMTQVETALVNKFARMGVPGLVQEVAKWQSDFGMQVTPEGDTIPAEKRFAKTPGEAFFQMFPVLREKYVPTNTEREAMKREDKIKNVPTSAEMDAKIEKGIKQMDEKQLKEVRMILELKRRGKTLPPPS